MYTGMNYYHAPHTSIKRNENLGEINFYGHE